MVPEESWRVQTKVTPIPHSALHSCSQCSCLYHNQPQLRLSPLTFNLSTHFFHSTAVCSCVRWLRGRVAWDHLSSCPFPLQLHFLFLSQQQKLISTPNFFVSHCLVNFRQGFAWWAAVTPSLGMIFQGTFFHACSDTFFCFHCSSTFGFDSVWFLFSCLFFRNLQKKICWQVHLVSLSELFFLCLFLFLLLSESQVKILSRVHCGELLNQKF